MLSLLELQTKCDVCGSTAYEVPSEYIDNFRWRDGDGKQALIEELVKPSPEFDQYLFDHREEILSQKNAKYNQAMARAKEIQAGKGSSVTCPYCKSPNVSKISTLGRGMSIGFFGLASSKIGKQWKCNNCKSNF